jgi:preprotein translocase subunit SecF
VVDLFRERKWDLVHRRWIYYLISLILLVAGLGTLAMNKYAWPGHPALNWGIDFTGGTVYTYKLGERVPAGQAVKVISDIRAALRRERITRAEIQLSGPPTTTAKDRAIIRTQLQGQPEVIERQKEQIAGLMRGRFPKVESLGSETVGGLISENLKWNGLFTFAFGCGLILIWVTIRYEFKYAICGIIALLHDIGVLVGSFALLYRLGLGAEVNSPFVAAVLTVLGYSVHDSVVIFDRIRENVRLRKRPTFAETVNVSLLETMARSVNTVLTLEFTLLAVFLLGGPSLRDFSLAMLIGVTIGAYSSIFNASQLLVGWKGREQLARAPRAAAEVRVAPTSGVVRRQPTRPAAPAADQPTETTETATSPPGEQPAAPAAEAEQAPPAAGEARPRPARAKGRGKGKKRRRRY